MKVLINISFLTPFSLFLVHQIVQLGLNIQLPFFDNYLDPFCLGAIVPHLVLIEQRFLFHKNHISVTELLILLPFLAVTTELVFPLINPNFYCDPIDVLAIFLGGIWFLLTHSKVNSIVFYQK